MFAREERGFVDELDHVLVKKDFVLFACGLDAPVTHGSFEIEDARGGTVIEEVLHYEQEPVEFDACCRVLNDDLIEA